MKKFFTSFFAIYFMMISFAPQIVQASSYEYSSTVSAPIGISVGASVPDLASPPESQFFWGAIIIGSLVAAIGIAVGITIDAVYKYYKRKSQRA